MREGVVESVSTANKITSIKCADGFKIEVNLGEFTFKVKVGDDIVYDVDKKGVIQSIKFKGTNIFVYEK